MDLFTTITLYGIDEDVMPVIKHEIFKVYELRNVGNLVEKASKIVSVDRNDVLLEMKATVKGRSTTQVNDCDKLFPDAYYEITFRQKIAEEPLINKDDANSNPLNTSSDDKANLNSSMFGSSPESNSSMDFDTFTQERRRPGQMSSTQSVSEILMEENEENLVCVEKSCARSPLHDFPSRTEAMEKRKIQRLAEFADNCKDEIDNFLNNINSEKIIQEVSLLDSVRASKTTSAAVYVMHHRMKWKDDAVSFAEIAFRRWIKTNFGELSAAEYAEIFAFLKINYEQNAVNAFARCNKRLLSPRDDLITKRKKFSLECKKTLQEQLDMITTEMNDSGGDKVKLDELFKKASPLMIQWIDMLQKDKSLDKGQATTIVKKFKYLKRNCAFLHHAFLARMKKNNPKIISLSSVFDLYVPKIFSEGRRNGLYKGPLDLDIDDDVRYEACEVLCRLIRRSCKRNPNCVITCIFINQKDNLTLNQAILDVEFNEGIPKICLVNSGQNVQYFIIIENDALLVQGNFSIALQTLLDVFYVCNLKYNLQVKLFFDILEMMVKIVGVRTLPVSRLWDAIDGAQK